MGPAAVEGGVGGDSRGLADGEPVFKHDAVEGADEGGSRGKAKGGLTGAQPRPLGAGRAAEPKRNRNRRAEKSQKILDVTVSYVMTADFQRIAHCREACTFAFGRAKCINT